MRTSSFTVFPSVGSLVPGWLLVVPNLTFTCVGEIPVEQHAELEDLVGFLKGKLDRHFGRVVSFEHGPSCINSLAGCGVNQAHVHLVPFQGDLKNAVQEFVADKLNWEEVANWSDLARPFSSGMDYLYLEQDGKKHFAAAPKFGSQLFRRAIASHVGHPERYDWKQYDNAENLESTISLFANELSTAH